MKGEYFKNLSKLKAIKPETSEEAIARGLIIENELQAHLDRLTMENNQLQIDKIQAILACEE